MRKLVLHCLAAALVVLPTRTNAALLVYTTLSSYQAATTSNTTYTFSGAPVNYYTLVSPSYTFGGLTFSASALHLENDGEYGAGVNYLDNWTSSGETITLYGATALSFTLGT